MRIKAKLAKQDLRFLAQEFATYHMAWAPRALEDDDPDAVASKLDGECSTGKSTTDSNDRQRPCRPRFDRVTRSLPHWRGARIRARSSSWIL